MQTQDTRIPSVIVLGHSLTVVGLGVSQEMDLEMMDNCHKELQTVCLQDGSALCRLTMGKWLQFTIPGMICWT